MKLSIIEKKRLNYNGSNMHFVFFGEHDRCHFAPTARAALVQRGGGHAPWGGARVAIAIPPSLLFFHLPVPAKGRAEPAHTRRPPPHSASPCGPASLRTPACIFLPPYAFRCSFHQATARNRPPRAPPPPLSTCSRAHPLAASHPRARW
jgi:hypothetical protein